MGQVSSVVIDTHSKWMEIETVKSATAKNTTEHLQMVFARVGMQKVMVMVSGSFFTINFVTSLNLPHKIESSIYALSPITPLPMLRQRELCRPLSYRNKETVSWYIAI